MTTAVTRLQLRTFVFVTAIVLMGASLTAEARCGYNPYTLEPDCSNIWSYEMERSRQPPEEVYVSAPRVPRVNYQDTGFIVDHLLNGGRYQIPSASHGYTSVKAPALTEKQLCEAKGGRLVSDTAIGLSGRYESVTVCSTYHISDVPVGLCQLGVAAAGGTAFFDKVCSGPRRPACAVAIGIAVMACEDGPVTDQLF